MAKVIEFDDRRATCADEPSLLQWGRDRYSEIARKNGLNPEIYIGDEMDAIYGYRSLFDQLMPLRDVLPRLWKLPTSDASRALTVVSTHTSRSILLPVYRLEVPGVGVFHLRNNFYDWRLSCALEFRVPNDLWGDFFDVSVTGTYFEGFREAWKYKPFVVDQQKFSLALSPTFESLYTFMVILRLHAVKLGLAKPRIF